MAKKIIGSLKLQVKAQQANPSPPVGPALGQRGLNIMAFVKEFNAKTADIAPGTPTPVIITYYQDKSFSLELKTAPASFLIKQAAGLPAVGKRSRAKGSMKPGREGTTRGRPTWVEWAGDGALLVSDDTAGIIWRVVASNAEPRPAIVRQRTRSLPPQRELSGNPDAAFRDDPR